MAVIMTGVSKIGLGFLRNVLIAWRWGRLKINGIEIYPPKEKNIKL